LLKYKRVASQYEVPKKIGKKILINEKSIALFRKENKIFAIQNSCPHQGGDLAHGYVKDGKVVCPLHGWMFYLETGAFTHNESMNLKTYPLKIINEEVYIGLEDE